MAVSDPKQKLHKTWLRRIGQFEMPEKLVNSSYAPVRKSPNWTIECPNCPKAGRSRGMI
jgi:hypothetical protein